MDAQEERSELLKKYNFAEEERAEQELDVIDVTGYPQPEFAKRLIFESYNQYVEEAYFWIVDHIRHDFSFNKFYKITDVFAATEQSAFFGVSEQRLGLQQDKASQYLRGISEMIKALFQVVRELRIIDERLFYYDDSFKYSPSAKMERARASEITLKGIWVDQVEGGVKNAGSVYGLAQTVGFTILPDLFFRVEIDDSGFHKLRDNPSAYRAGESQLGDKVTKGVDRLTEFNPKVREVLKRKLAQYYIWKTRTYKELHQRRIFTIKYLRQHYDTIKLYIGWIKPYLRNIRRLQLDTGKMDSYEMISAFEGAMIEIEVLAVVHDIKKYKTFYPCMVLNFVFRTRPSETYTQEGYQRGPAHTGKYEMNIRSYIWTKEQIENYQRMRDEEALSLISSIDESLKAALDSLGDELKLYLIEGGEDIDMPKEEPPQPPSMLDPFKAIGAGFGEIFGSVVKIPKVGSKKGKADSISAWDEHQKAKAHLQFCTYQAYKNFKKFHGFIQW